MNSMVCFRGTDKYLSLVPMLYPVLDCSRAKTWISGHDKTLQMPSARRTWVAEIHHHANAVATMERFVGTQIRNCINSHYVATLWWIGKSYECYHISGISTKQQYPSIHWLKRGRACRPKNYLCKLKYFLRFLDISKALAMTDLDGIWTAVTGKWRFLSPFALHCIALLMDKPYICLVPMDIIKIMAYWFFSWLCHAMCEFYEACSCCIFNIFVILLGLRQFPFVVAYRHGSVELNQSIRERY